MAHRCARQEKIEWAPSHYDCRPSDFLLTGFACVRGGLFGGHCFSVWGEGEEKGEERKGVGAWRSNLTSKPWKVRALTQVRFSQKIQKTDEGDLTTRTLSGKWHPAAHRLRVSSATTPPLCDVPPSITAILAKSRAQRTDQERDQLAAFYRSIAPQLCPVRERLATLVQQLQQVE